MKRLLLIRHAKSSWKFPELDDHERPLNTRGERDRWQMAEHLAGLDERLQAIHSSTAVRALCLAEAIGQTLQVTIVERQALYTFAVQQLSSALQQLPDELERVAVVGHNPAVTEFVNQFAHAGLDNVPTSGVVALHCGCRTWSNLLTSGGEIDYFVAPKLLS